MKKLSKDQITQKEALGTKLSEAHARLADVREALSQAIEDFKVDVEPAETAYNDALAEARVFAEEIASDIREAWEDKSETWQESETGQVVDTWASDWEAFAEDAEDSDLASVAFELPELDEPGEDAGEALDALDNEAEG